MNASYERQKEGEKKNEFVCVVCKGQDFDSNDNCVDCLHALATILNRHHIPWDLKEEASRSIAAWETFIQKPLDERWEIIFKDMYDRGLL